MARKRKSTNATPLPSEALQKQCDEFCQAARQSCDTGERDHSRQEQLVVRYKQLKKDFESEGLDLFIHLNAHAHNLLPTVAKWLATQGPERVGYLTSSRWALDSDKLLAAFGLGVFESRRFQKALRDLLTATDESLTWPEALDLLRAQQRRRRDGSVSLARVAKKDTWTVSDVEEVRKALSKRPSPRLVLPHRKTSLVDAPPTSSPPPFELLPERDGRSPASDRPASLPPASLPPASLPPASLPPTLVKQPSANAAPRTPSKPSLSVVRQPLVHTAPRTSPAPLPPVFNSVGHRSRFRSAKKRRAPHHDYKVCKSPALSTIDSSRLLDSTYGTQDDYLSSVDSPEVGRGHTEAQHDSAVVISPLRFDERDSSLWQLDSPNSSVVLIKARDTLEQDDDGEDKEDEDDDGSFDHAVWTDVEDEDDEQDDQDGNDKDQHETKDMDEGVKHKDGAEKEESGQVQAQCHQSSHEGAQDQLRDRVTKSIRDEAIEKANRQGNKSNQDSIATTDPTNNPTAPPMLSPIDAASLRRLQPGQELNDTLLSTALETFTPRHVRLVLTVPPREDSDDGWKSWAASHSYRLEPDTTHVVVPLHRPRRRHWVLLMLDLPARRVSFFDSMACPEDSSSMLAIARAIATSCGADWDRDVWTFHSAEVPQQSNTHDCGLYAIVFALVAINKFPMPKAIDGLAWRHILALALGSVDSIAPSPPSAPGPDASLKHFSQHVQDLEARVEQLRCIEHLLAYHYTKLTQQAETEVIQRQQLIQEISHRQDALTLLSKAAALSHRVQQSELECLAHAAFHDATRELNALTRKSVQQRIACVLTAWDTSQLLVDAAETAHVSAINHKTGCESKLKARLAEHARQDEERAREKKEIERQLAELS